MSLPIHHTILFIYVPKFSTNASGSYISLTPRKENSLARKEMQFRESEFEFRQNDETEVVMHRAESSEFQSLWAI